MGSDVRSRLRWARRLVVLAILLASPVAHAQRHLIPIGRGSPAADRTPGRSGSAGAHRPADRRAPSESEPIAGVLVHWDCHATEAVDDWDRLWMRIIAGTVRAGVLPYGLLQDSSGDHGTEVQQVCARRLEQAEGIAAEDVVWLVDGWSPDVWIRDYGPLVTVRRGGRVVVEDSSYYPGESNPAVCARTAR